MSLYTVRVTARRAGDADQTHRHYPIYAKTPSEALEIVEAMKPFSLPSVRGVLFGHMLGSTFAVTGMLAQ
jgi:hypothetical protein